MPTHTTDKDIGKKKRGDGQPLTAIERASNALAAKRTHQDQQASIVEDVAKWIGRATFSANNQPSHPTRDTAARKPKGGKGRVKKVKRIVEARAICLGGTL